MHKYGVSRNFGSRSLSIVCSSLLAIARVWSVPHIRVITGFCRALSEVASGLPRRHAGLLTEGRAGRIGSLRLPCRVLREVASGLTRRHAGLRPKEEAGAAVAFGGVAEFLPVSPLD